MNEPLEQISAIQLMETLADGVVILDMDLRIVRFNTAFGKMFPEARQGKNAFCYREVQHQDTHCAGCPALLCLESGKKERAVIQGPPGSPALWRDIYAVPIRDEGTGKYIGILEHVKDITLQRSIEEALLEKDAFFQYSGDLFSIIDREGDFIEVNPAWTTLLGWKKDDLAGRQYLDLVHPDDRSQVMLKASRILANGETVHGKSRVSCADGSYKLISWYLYPAEDRYYGVARDITQLAEVRREYHRLFTEMQDAFALHEIICDNNGTPRDYRFIEVNPAFERLTGLSREQVVGRRVLDVLPQTEEYWIEIYGRVALTGEPAAFEHYSQSFDRTYFVSAFQPFYGQFAVFFQDTTERVKMERELLRERQLLRTIIDHVPVGIYVMDRDLKKILVNPKDVEHIGAASQEEVLGKTDEQLYPPETAKRLMEDNLRVLRDNRAVFDREEQLVDRSGRNRWLLTSKVPLTDEHGMVYGLLGIGHDITEKKENEQEMLAMARFPQENPNPVFRVSWEGRILYINEEGKRLLPEWKLVEGETTSQFIRDLVEEVQTKGSPKKLELTHGDETYSFYIVPFSHAGYANFYGADISELLKTKQLHEDLEAQLYQAQKIESIGRLAGGVAHDFNNMLGVILGYAELAMEKIGPQGEGYEDLLEIKQAADRSVSLTQKLLAFARRQSIHPRVMDLNERIRSIKNMLSRLVGEHIKLTWKPQRGVWHVCMDPIQVDQMLMNLATNASDAIADTGRLIIETANVTIDQQYASAFYECSPGDYVLLTVSDTGKGMDRETMAHVFEPFFTTKRLGQGTGMGLATIHGIVRQNGGFVYVYSELGQGTTVRIYLPRSGGEPEESLPVSPQQHQGSESVLVVEDEQAIRNLAAVMLEKNGYQVYTAGTVDEALEIAGKLSSGIDLLITDVVMPEMNGRQLADLLAGILPPFKIMYMSGYTADVIAHHGVLDDGVTFIQKPFTARELTSFIRRVLDS